MKTAIKNETQHFPPTDTPNKSSRHAWNKGKLLGQKPPPKLKEVWEISVRLQLSNNLRELALFNLAIDSKLRGCDLVKLKALILKAVRCAKCRMYRGTRRIDQGKTILTRKMRFTSFSKSYMPVLFIERFIQIQHLVYFVCGSFLVALIQFALRLNYTGVGFIDDVRLTCHILRFRARCF
jgi:hypothetical protein